MVEKNQSEKPVMTQRNCNNTAAALVTRCRIALLAFSLVLGTTAFGAETYPSKPVRMIVPFAPGGSADIVARLVVQPLAAHWGVQVIIDNRGGAGGNVAGELAAAASPDGYTVFQINVANTIAATLYKDLKYNPVRDFAPVTQLASSPFVLVVNPSVAAKSVQEFVALARSRPAQFTYGSSGNGGSSHLLMELMKSMAGIDLVHVPYNSSPTLHADLMAGRIQATFATPAAMMPYIRAGKLRGLGIGGKQRSPLAPDMPTIAESGVPGFEGGTWFGLVVPARTPRAVITKLHADVAQILRQPEVRERMLAQGVEPGTGSNPEEFARFIKSEIEKWARIVKQSGARVE
jgi:tripartite-type tricarboxylate transporter receptor subunit TctC